MATITHQFIPNQTVWQLTATCGVKEALILLVKPVLSVSNLDLVYNIRVIDDNTTVDAFESELFDTLSGPGSALEAYEAQLTT